MVDAVRVLRDALWLRGVGLYVAVSDEIVLARLEDLGDLRSFVRAVAAYVRPGN